MGKTEFEKIAKRYLGYLKQNNIVDELAFLVLFGNNSRVSPSQDDKIEVVVVYKKFGLEMVKQQTDLIAATWNVDPRIIPFGASIIDWNGSSESPKLTRAKETGTIISD